MHILFIANCGSLYGANRSMLDLAAGLQRLGHNIFFLLPSPDSGEERKRIKKELDRHKFFYAFFPYVPSVHVDSEKSVLDKMLRGEINRRCLRAIINYMDGLAIDLIHTNSLTHRIGAQLSRKMRIPHVWHIREALRQDYRLDFDNKILYRRALKQANRVICISDYIRGVHKRMLHGTNAITIYDGFDIKRYMLDGNYSKHTDQFRLVICGIIQEGKGQLEAVEAVEMLVTKHDLRNVFLQVVGDGDGEYCLKIKDYIVSKRLENYVEMLPFQADLTNVRRKAQIALVCSRSEALGRVTVESMLSENLVIGADSAGTAELIKHGVNGYLYKTGSADDLCRKIYDVITHWHEQGKVIAHAKEYAKQTFRLDDYTKNILEIYQSVVKKKVEQ